MVSVWTQEVLDVQRVSDASFCRHYGGRVEARGLCNLPVCNLHNVFYSQME